MNIATIGSGFIVDSFIEAISLVENANLEAVYSRTQERANEFKEKHHANKAYDDIDKMLQDEDINIVYVASPNSLHYEQSKKALQAKKHVICEKPFTSTPEELEDLIQCAKDNGVMIFEAITTIHLPNFKLIKMNLNEIGDIRMVNVCYCQYSSRYTAYTRKEESNVFSLEYSGGSLVDLNVYNVHFVVALFGAPKHVAYYPSIGFNGVDTNGTAILTYDTFQATLVGAKDSVNDNHSFIQGDKGNLQIVGSVGSCETIQYLPLVSAKLGRKTIGNVEDISTNQNQKMTYELLDFMRIIETNNTAEYERLLDHSRIVMDVLYKARQFANIKFDADK